MLRYRGNKKVLKTVKELDAFPKVPETYVETTPEGGTLSLITFVMIIYLVYSEVSYYIDSRLVFKFSPDTDMDSKLKINIDLTIAMPCSGLGADILDSTSQSVFGFGELQEEDTWFALSQNQRDYFDSMKYLNSHLREEYHAISKLLWKSGQSAIRYSMPERIKKPDRKPDACRLHGALTLNKVAGNFHVTAGKSLHLPRGHIHLNMLFDDTKQNFSHRIDKLSFGDPAAGIIHPLEGDEKITDKENMLFQYFIEVVPTDVDTTLSQIKTFQYAVKEHSRPVDHEKGSHGVPGVFIKYDVAALKVRVFQERDNLIQFSIRLFSIIGGIYIIMGFLNNAILTTKTWLKPSVPSPLTSDTIKTSSLFTTPELSVPVDIIKH